MKIKKSLKKDILHLLLYFSISVIIIIGTLSIISQYKSKIIDIEYYQNLVLKQVSSQVELLISDIEEIAVYLSLEYKNHHTLKDIVKSNKNISTILILDDNGIIEDFYAISKQNVYKGFDYSEKNYFKQLKNKNTYWSNIFLSALDEKPKISYSFKKSNKVFVILIDLSELSKFISRFRNYDNSNMIRVFDKNGIMIVNDDNKQLVLQRYNAIKDEVFTQLIDKQKRYKQVIFKSSGKKNYQYGSYTKIEKTGWNIVVREAYSSILKSLNLIIISMILVIVLFIIISIFLSFRFSKKIFNSFDDIQQITSDISDGKYKSKLNSLHYIEFDELLKSFNKMQNKIDKREERLESSLASFKSLVNSTMESIILDENKICFEVNDICVKLFNANSKEDFIGKKLIDFVAPEYKKTLEENYNKNTKPYEVEFIKLDGSRMQTLIQENFLIMEGKKIKVTAIIDITELKSKDFLLFQQGKMASMGEMIGNIAHQWRQPLTVISTCASNIKFQKEYLTLSDDEFYKSVDIITEQTHHLSKTIDDFRNFFRPEKGLDEFLIKDCIEKVLKLLTPSLEQNNIMIETKFLDKDFRFIGYPNELIQVLINIINNSKDAFLINKNEERTIIIEELEFKDKYILKIKDNAGGIPEEILRKIFDPYFTTKHKSQGTGIGLYMSHQIIVDHMKGKLKVQNIDEGCCFSIELIKEEVLLPK